MELIMNEPESCRSSDILIIKMLIYDPHDPKEEKFKIINVDHHKSLFTASLHLTKEQVDIVLCYKKNIYFIAILREAGNEFEWSNTMLLKATFVIKTAFPSSSSERGCIDNCVIVIICLNIINPSTK